MIDGETKAVAANTVFRSVENRSKILMRAESVHETNFPTTSTRRVLGSDSGKQTFCVTKDVSKCLQGMFQTLNPILCVGYCGSEMEMIMMNFIDASDTVLVGVVGEMGKDAVHYAHRIRAKVHTVDAYVGRVLDYDTIEAHISTIRPTVFFIVHGENSTGVLQPLDRIGELCRKHECLLIVDVVDTLGAVKLSIDNWKIDVAYGSSQKGLGGQAGIVPISYSPRALGKLANRQTRIPNSRWDMNMLINAWHTYDETRFLYSDLVPVSLLFILRDNLNKITDEGLPNVIERHYANSRRLQTALETVIGMELFVDKEEHRLPTVITVKMPFGINDKSFTKYLSHRHLIEISPGVGGTTGQIIRIGLSNCNANRKTVDSLIKAFYDALKMMTPNYLSQSNTPYFYY